ncbi:PREDICTED: carbonic anhydrase 1-like [Dinoponera quadriceps]|uniref:Carbonic anhydrase 1-like n=1 Tax=Dinoponera quadriceps TaxID=609295 RepID=A0A6P3XNB5_DINQU|nr:PREDICTED: carbonic anhydrase 1-like [Dinoponera quadriceps]
MKLPAAPFGLLLLAGLCLGAEFGYSGENGPENWSKISETCGGKNQSPINIIVKDTKSSSFPPLEVSFRTYKKNPFDKDSCQLTLVNNGHSAQLQSTDNMEVTVKGGPLKDTYTFQQLHFHWGRNNSEGSETLINNKPCSLEMHVVCRNEKYKSMAEAVNHADGLAVLGYMYHVPKGLFFYKNPILTRITSALQHMKDAGMNKTLCDCDLLQNLILPPTLNFQTYYTYNGSLTTPPCSESVTWFVFETILELANSQLKDFRKLKSSDGTPMTHNFRPPQPLGDREVYRNIPQEQNSGQCNTKSSYMGNTLAPLLGLGLSLV